MEWLKALVAQGAVQVVQLYDQGEDDRRGRHDNGWCNGLVTYWLWCHAANGDFWQWSHQRGSDALIRSVQTRANMLRREFAGHAAASVAAADTTLQGLGLRQGEVEDAFALSPQALAAAITHADGILQLIHLRGPQLGHAIGVVRRGGMSSVFDPNYGDYLVDTDDVGAFFTGLFPELNYDRDYNRARVLPYA